MDKLKKLLTEVYKQKEWKGLALAFSHKRTNDLDDLSPNETALLLGYLKALKHLGLRPNHQQQSKRKRR